MPHTRQEVGMVIHPGSMTVNSIGKNLPRPWTPDVLAELAVCASEHGAPVAVLWGNDDFCIIKKVREDVRHDVIK